MDLLDHLTINNVVDVHYSRPTNATAEPNNPLPFLAEKPTTVVRVKPQPSQKPLRKLTSVQKVAGLCIWQWFRVVVPPRKHFRAVRRSSVLIQGAWRMCVVRASVNQCIQRVVYLQSVMRRWLLQSAYAESRKAIICIQQCYRSSSRKARHYYVLTQWQASRGITRGTQRKMKDLKSCVHRRLGWAICPITHDWIGDPVLNVVDGHIYERNALNEALHRNPISPLNREPNDPQLCQSFVGVKNQYDQLLMENKRLREQNRNLQCDTVCNVCGKTFNNAKSCHQHKLALNHI